MIRCIYLLAVLVCLIGVGPAEAQNAPARDPGYVDFSVIDGWFDQQATIEVNIKGALMRMVAEASRHEDPELAELLSKLRAIYVRGYPVQRGQYEALERRAADLGSRLRAQGWETVARVRDNDDRVDMYTKEAGNGLAGMVVFVLDPDENETVFVNIVGDIDPADIGRLGSKFQIHGLDDRE